MASLIDISTAICVLGITLGGMLAAFGTDVGTALKAIFSEKSDRGAVRTGIVVFEKGKSIAATSGVLTALIGLVIMLKNMDDPQTLAPGMGFAYLAVVYALLLAFGVFAPLVALLRQKEEYADEECPRQSSSATEGSSQKAVSPHIYPVGKILSILIMGSILGFIIAQSEKAGFEEGQQLTREQYIENFDQYKEEATEEPMPVWGGILAMSALIGFVVAGYELLGFFLGELAGRIPFLPAGLRAAGERRSAGAESTVQVFKKYGLFAVAVMIIQVILAWAMIRFVLKDEGVVRKKEALTVPVEEEAMAPPIPDGKQR